MASRYEGWARIDCWKPNRRAGGIFKIQEALSRVAIARTLALPTPLDRDDKDDVHRADPEADKRILAQLESGTKALQMTSKGQHRRACSQRRLCSGRSSNQLISPYFGKRRCCSYLNRVHTKPPQSQVDSEESLVPGLSSIWWKLLSHIQ